MTATPTALPWRHPTVLRSLEGPAAHSFLHTQWPALHDQDPHATAFQGPGWQRGWAAVLPPSATLEIRVVENLRGQPGVPRPATRDSRMPKRRGVDGSSARPAGS